MMAASAGDEVRRKGCTERVFSLPVVIIGVGVLFGILRFNQDVLEEWQQRVHAFAAGDSTPMEGPAGSHVRSSGVEALLASIRAKTILAADGAEYSMTSAERSAWNAKNPCRSRTELPQIYALRKHVATLSPNSLWNEVLEEYSNLHRTCRKRVGDFTDYFINRANESIPGCNFLIGRGTGGLGNKLLVTVSAVLYAVLTQRVLLIPRFSTNFDSIFCEPFVGSSWMLDTFVFRKPTNIVWDSADQFSALASARWQLLKEEGGEENCSGAECVSDLPPLPKGVIVSSRDANWLPKEWFYCNMEQELLSKVQWVYLSGCIYFIPKIFASPAFVSTLRELFPENLVLTRLLRSTMLPSDRIWSRFKHLNHAYFDRAARRVGIQVRFFHDHEKMSETISDRVMDCVLTNRILPNVSNTDAVESNSTQSGFPASPTITMVYIASLFIELHDRMTEYYLRNPTVTREDVGIVQLTNHRQQSGGVEEDSEAMVEVLLLSVTDALLVTPVSTFGGMAQGYGGLVPWFIRTTRGAVGPSCERGFTVDTCEQGGNLTYSCPYRDGEWDLARSQIRPCIDVYGVQVPLNH